MSKSAAYNYNYSEEDLKTIMSAAGVVTHLCDNIKEMVAEISKLTDAGKNGAAIAFNTIYPAMNTLGDLINSWDSVTEDDNWCQSTFDRMVDLENRINTKERGDG